MRKLLFLLTLFFAYIPNIIFSQTMQNRLIDCVNPFVGTQNMGHTFPGVCAPFGAVQLSPDTEMIPHNIDGVYQPESYRYCAGYQYEDKTIIGFSHTHFSGTGHSDLGDILIMPATGKVQLEMGTAENSETGYRSSFRHETEQAHPGYYSVVLDDYAVKAELTATERAGIHKYTFPKGEGHIILDLSYGIYNYEGKILMSNLRVEDDYTFTGYRITSGWSRMNYTYFAVKFSKPIKNYGCKNDEIVQYKGFWRKFNVKDNFPEMFGAHLTAFFNFDFDEGEALEMKIALSAVDCSGALQNLRTETEGKSFEQLKQETQDKWEKELSVIEIEEKDEKKFIFYTALYRTLIHPSLYQDVDGRYRGIDHNIHQADPGSMNYTVFSVWDTFRAQHPLMNLIKRKYSRHFANSLLNHYQQSVHKALPVWSHHGNENWCMIGYHSVSVIADAIIKGIEMNNDLALEACLNSSTLLYYDAIGDYLRLGYVPLEKSTVSASQTLEYAYDDWAIFQLANKLENNDIATKYAQKSLNYKNVFDRNVGFARPRNGQGIFQEPFDLLETHGQGFIEGNSWNYSFFVPHDVEGLINEMGGEKRFVERLDSLFTMPLPEKYFANTEDITKDGLMGNYIHGNEPSHHVAYLYAWTAQPWKTQYRVHEIMNKMYKNKPDGLCGNDDCGQMSAWYVFSSMGFYPVCPGTDEYVLGSPNILETTINLENGKIFTIKAPALNPENIYVKSVTLNGQPYHKSFIRHQDIMNGGELIFEMSSQPNKKRVFELEEKPYSFSD